MSDLTSFCNLPPSLQCRIDRAFDLSASSVTPKSDHSLPTARESLDGSSRRDDTGGGFIVDEPVKLPAEGASNDEPKVTPDRIPLRVVPEALRRLNLPSNDQQVLSVFRNAASGWSSATNNVGCASGGLISREDWRSVCSVLYEHRAEEPASDYDVQNGDFDEEESDEYHDSASHASSEDSVDEYFGERASLARRHRTRMHHSPSDSHSEPSRQGDNLTKRQKDVCMDAFALFFPSTPLNELPNQKIMIKDIQRVANILGEKLKMEEIIEMLEVFSSSPEKIMNLADFSRMMAAAKLVGAE
ncbi:hypothetical protein AX17_004105 [Amanita inopinata Kibby_2008]|nr:hypothetical protein AX17_004105 [Amanita inopinata Kibby_2008]